MAESAESLFRRGMISSRQAGKLGVLKGTRAQPAHMEPFEGKQGRRDQGGRSDRGDTVLAGVGHINAKTARDFGTPARAGGRPSRGGTTFNKNNDVPDYEQIDEGSEQTPTFPRGQGRMSRNAQPGYVPTSRTRLAAKTRGNHGANDRGPDNKTPQRARGGNPRSSGGQYGGPNSRANG